VIGPDGRCQRCRQKVVAAIDPSGRALMLSEEIPVYLVRPDGRGGWVANTTRTTESGRFLASHFATCAAPTQYAARRRKEDLPDD
jgi:hypothetical protein